MSNPLNAANIIDQAQQALVRLESKQMLRTLQQSQSQNQTTASVSSAKQAPLNVAISSSRSSMLTDIEFSGIGTRQGEGLLVFAGVDPSAVGERIRQLGDEDVALRDEGARVLLAWARRHDSVIDALIVALSRTTDPEVRQRLCYILCSVWTEEAAKVFSELLDYNGFSGESQLRSDISNRFNRIKMEGQLRAVLSALSVIDTCINGTETQSFGPVATGCDPKQFTELVGAALSVLGSEGGISAADQNTVLTNLKAAQTCLLYLECPDTTIHISK